MPVFYVMAAVISGLFAALSSLVMGHPPMLAVLVYALFGASFTIVLAVRLATRQQKRRSR